MKRKANDPRSAYILAALERHCLNGDAYVMVEELYALCCTLRPRLGYEAFERDFTEQLGFGNLCREGRRIYLAKTLRYEEAAAKHLADILQENERPLSGALPEMSEEIGVELAAEQRNAVRLALSHRLSIILGGAGSGKTTLIRAICRCAPRANGKVICAPTGKAARNLTERTGLVARTVHSALGMQPNDDFLSPVLWEHVGLVVVDEASMLSLEMLAGLLCKMRPQCTMVLLGDPNQLLSVGSGNVLPDLLRLGIPAVHLEQNHRQADAAAGLQGNVVNFSRLGAAGDLAYDDSFRLEELYAEEVERKLVEQAVELYCAGEDMQVLSAYNRATNLSAWALNRRIRERVNPPAEGKRELLTRDELFRNGDRVIITKNDRERNCSNGDVGVLRIVRDTEEDLCYFVALPDGRQPCWHTMAGLNNMALAYALTVHKSQGSQYDSVLMPVTDAFGNMLYRNLFYTAISRAKKEVVLYGSRNAVGLAMQRSARNRNSQLVAKTHMELHRCA